MHERDKLLNFKLFADFSSLYCTLLLLINDPTALPGINAWVKGRPSIDLIARETQCHSNSVGKCHSQSVGKCHSNSVGKCHSQSVGKCHSHSVGKCHSQSVGKCHSHSVGKCHSNSVGKCHSRSVGKCHSHSVGKCHSQSVRFRELCDSELSLLSLILMVIFKY